MGFSFNITPEGQQILARRTAKSWYPDFLRAQAAGEPALYDFAQTVAARYGDFDASDGDFVGAAVATAQDTKSNLFGVSVDRGLADTLGSLGALGGTIGLIAGAVALGGEFLAPELGATAAAEGAVELSPSFAAADIGAESLVGPATGSVLEAGVQASGAIALPAAGSGLPLASALAPAIALPGLGDLARAAGSQLIGAGKKLLSDVLAPAPARAALSPAAQASITQAPPSGGVDGGLWIVALVLGAVMLS